MTEPSLQKLFEAHRGKVADKWELYLAEYDRLFSPCRDDPVRLLEIGVQNGGSLEIWSKYFRNAEVITGCDINPKCAELEFSDPRIAVVSGDVSCKKTRAKLLGLSDAYDIVIDDGSHTSSDIVKSFCGLFPSLAAGGIYVIEDLHCSYWLEFEGGLYAPHSAISFLKSLADIVNFEHWGVNSSSEELIANFSGMFEPGQIEEALHQVHSVEFINSMCAVRRCGGENNQLGRRVIAGRQEAVKQGHLDLPAEHRIVRLPQAANAWSVKDIPSAGESPGQQEKLTELGLELQRCYAAIESLIQQADEDKNRLSQLQQDLDSRSDRLEKLTRNNRELGARLTGVNQRLEKRDIQLLTANQELVAQRVLVDFARNSRTWRWTSLFRTIGNRKRFDRKFYLERYPDVVDSGMDPLEHYLAYGRREGRESLHPTRLGYYGKLARALNSLGSTDGGWRSSIKALTILLRREGLSGIMSHMDEVLGDEELIGYSEWVRAYGTLDVNDRNRIRSRIEEMHFSPLISVVMPTFNTNLDWLKAAIESVRTQLYPNWELCIADDASTDADVKLYLEELNQSEERIKVVFRQENGHISRASNSALGLCTGEWVALLDHDDLLAEHALFCVAEAVNRDPDLQLIYSDEDKIDLNGQRISPYFKTDWNPDLFYSHNMISHLGVYRKKVLDRIGGFRPGFEGSQDYDLALRFIEQIDPAKIHHIPRVLYHWRLHPESTASSTDAKPYALLAAEKALQEHFDRRGIGAEIEALPYGYRVHYTLPEPHPLVSLIIPTRNGIKLIRACIESILEKTRYQNFEILIVDNGSDDPEILQYFEKLSQWENIRILRDDEPFNFSRLNNQAVGEAKGELIGFVNNDIEVIAGDWLSELVSLALQPGVGAAGAKLLYPDGTVQHAGVVLGVGGVAAHAFKGRPSNGTGFCCRAILISAFSALTAACMVINKDVFLQAGGFDEEHLKVAFGDVDLCLRIRELGYRHVFSPYALLYHHESASRGEDSTPEKQARFTAEINCMQLRWGELLRNDPAYNPNLTLHREDFSLAWPPRVEVIGGGQ